MKVAVVTPTIGSKFLERNLASVKSQTYKDLTHYIFIDGVEYADQVKDAIGDTPNIKTIELEENIGKGWYGHRVYAACSFLVNADIICYLDEDNWYEPNHVEALVKKIEAGAEWAYSLRSVYDKNGYYIFDDNCESLGKWPVYLNDASFHIDTSCFAIRRDVAVKISQTWYGQWAADRFFFINLKNNFPNFECSGQYSMCYQLDGNEGSVPIEFFEEGNAAMKERYQGKYPWSEKTNK
jgi:glycosyltransferase involved in cell wall biosynthesis